MAVVGSFDHPPIVIRSAWWKVILHYAAVAALIGVFLGTLKDESGDPLDPFAVFIVLFVFVFCLAMVLHGFLRSRIELSPLGIAYVSLIRRRSCSWAEMGDIQVVRSWSPHLMTNCIRLRGEGDDRKPAPQLTLIRGSGWPMSPQELGTLIRDARRRWDASHRSQEEILGQILPG